MHLILSFFALFLLSIENSAEARSAEADAPEKQDGWIEGKIKTLSIEEKIGQMLMLNLQGTSLDRQVAEMIDQVFCGSIILFESNIQSKEQLSLFVHHLQNRSRIRTGIPLMIAVDQEGGLVNRLGKMIDPKRSQFSARTLGRAYQFRKTSTQKALEKFYFELAKEMKEWGINLNLAPVLDLSEDPKSPLFSRSFGNDPRIVSALGKDMAKAMQRAGLMVTGKHFPNLGSSYIDSHKDLPVLHRTLRQMNQHEFVPYLRLKEQLDAIMLGHILVPHLDPNYPVSISPIASRYLRKKIQYMGVIITDDLKMGAITKNFSIEAIVKNLLQSEVDIFLVASESDMHSKIFQLILKEAKAHKSVLKRIDTSLRKILALKRRYLFDKDLIVQNATLNLWLSDAH